MPLKQRLKNGALTLKTAFVDFLKRRDPVEYFIALMLLGIAVFAVRVTVGGSATLTEIFHKDSSDLMMDYFNSLRDVSQGIGVYTDRRVIYPPLANLILLFLSKALPPAYLNTPGGSAIHTWRFYSSAVLSVTFFFVFTVLLLALVVGREKYPAVKKNLLVFLLMASFPVLFMIERGNIVILCLIALVVFAQNYNSESRVGREVALVMLAFATALKLYPALFGLVMLADRRYRDAFRAAFYAVLMLVIPSFFFGGPICLWWVVENTLYYSTFTGQDALNLFGSWNMPSWLGKGIFFGMYVFAAAFLVLASFVQRKAWKTWMFVAAILLTVSSIFSAYNWLLFLPALLTFMRKERLQGMNVAYFFLMTLPFYIYVPKLLQDNALITLMAVIIALCVLESIGLFVTFFKNRKQAALAESK